jgi:hypothetical protein
VGLWMGWMDGLRMWWRCGVLCGVVFEDQRTLKKTARDDYK